MSKGNLKSRFASYLASFRNDGNLRINTYEIELEEGINNETLRVKDDNDESENNPQNRLLISRNMVKLNESFEAIEQSSEDHLSIHFIINESFKRFDSELFEKLTTILRDKQIAAFQCESDGTFCIIWKKSKDETFAVNIFERSNINKEDLMSLCSYILEFLNKCLQNDHSGLLSGNNIPVDKYNMDLSLLGDSDGLNLLFQAASNGNSQIIPILLKVAFNVHMIHDHHLAGDLALRNVHFETISVLLKNNAAFPFGFNVENCPNDDLKTFVKMSQKFHDHIMTSNLGEIRNILSENLNLRYFYNTLNQSASAVALFYKKLEVYELLLQNNIYLSIWEDIDDITEILSEEEKREVREIHFRNKKDINQPHLNALLQKCSVGHDDEKVQERLNHVMRAFQELNKFPLIQILLKIAALLPNLQIVFDFNRDSVEYLDPTQNRSTLGLFYLNGRVYVGAKQLLNNLREHEVFATIAHELCHFVLFSLFDNMAKPYKDGDNETETEFEIISIECKLRNEIDEIISAVYDYYPPEMFHAELIVRIPHFYAHYCHQPEEIERLKVEFKSLFDFYELKLLPKLEESLSELKIEAEKEVEENKELKEKNSQMKLKIDLFETEQKNRKRKKESICKVSMIIGFIVMTCVGILLINWMYEPTYQWFELDDEQKMKVFNETVRFEGVDAKFHEIFGQNETANGVFNKLTSNQIKLLLNDDILDLNEDQNKFLQEDIFLIYQSLTENFKEKVQKSLIDFQGQQVAITSLLKEKTEKILKTFNSTQIIDLMRNKESIKIGQEIKSSTKFHIERMFVEKSLTNPSTKHASDLITESVIKRVILLSDDAGTGKTTTFRHLAFEYKQKYPLKWVQYVDLKSKIEIYQKYQNRKSNLKDILIEIFDVKDIFDIKIFEILYDDQNVVIFLDGFDEISPTYSKFILQIIENIKEQTQNIQFISTRAHYENYIKESLNCPVYKLKPLSKENNIEFLKEFYDFKNLTVSEMYKAIEKVQKFIVKVQKNIKNAPKYHLESPLMLEMIAEISLSDDEKFDGTNLYTIYDSFINAKLELTNYKGEIVRNEKNQNIRKGLNLDEIFQYFAVKSFGYKFDIIRKYENETLDKNQLSRYGILVFDSDGKAKFIHRTFEEFFFAQYFVDNLFLHNTETNCDEINKKFKIVIENTIDEENYKLQEFLSGYSEKFESGKVNENLSSCLKTHSELNNLFYDVFNKSGKNNFDPFKHDFDRVEKLLQILPFNSKLLEILWFINDDEPFFCKNALEEPKEFMYNFDRIKKILSKYFPNDKEKQKKLIFGKSQQGSILYIIYKYFKTFNVDKYLNLFNVSLDLDLTKLNNLKVFEFYNFIKPHLIDDEIREMFSVNFIDILAKDGVKMWNEIKSKFTHKELQELTYESRLKDLPLPWYINDFTVIKLIFKTLDGTPHSRFVKFLQYKNKLLLRKDTIMANDNFEVIWNMIENVTTVDERKKLLKLNLLDEKRTFGFNIFSASIESGTVEKFEFVKNIYEQNFNLTKMREFCEKYFEISREPNDPWHPNVETAQAFLNYLKTLFTFDEIKSKLRDPLIELYTYYSARENLNLSYPLFGLLKELKTVKELEINRLSSQFIKESKNRFDKKELLSLFVMPTNMDLNDLSKISTFTEFYHLIYSQFTNEEAQEYLKTNFIKIVTVGGVQMWSEIKSKLTHEKIKELIYKSKFKEKPLLYFIKDLTLIKSIFKTLNEIEDIESMQYDEFYNLLLLRKESMIVGDDFKEIWNVIQSRTTKVERKKILELRIHDIREINILNIFSSSIEYGSVETFQFVKNIYEQYFNSTEEMRGFCENYFKTGRFSWNFWHPNDVTAEDFVKYLKKLFTIDEIKKKFKKSLRKLYWFYGEKENLDFSYPFFSLLKEIEIFGSIWEEN